VSTILEALRKLQREREGPAGDPELRTPSAFGRRGGSVRRGGRTLLWVISPVLLGVAAGGTWYVWGPDPLSWLPFWGEEEAQEAPVARAERPARPRAARQGDAESLEGLSPKQRAQARKPRKRPRPSVRRQLERSPGGVPTARTGSAERSRPSSPAVERKQAESVTPAPEPRAETRTAAATPAPRPRPSPPPPTAKEPAPAPPPVEPQGADDLRLAESTADASDGEPGFPDILVESVRWHPDPERRQARVQIGRRGALELHEGDIVGGALIHRIDPASVEIQVGDVRRRLDLAP
jgi:hypothetical protein